MRTTIIAAIAILAPASARAEVPADVTVLFEQGLADMRAGNLEVACKQLAAALAKFDDSGIAGTLAECYTKQGKVVSAWKLWKELAETAAPALRPSAARNAAQLEPRLPRYTVRLQEPIAGLAITVNDDPVADPTLPTPLPVDPGPLVVVAKAPGREAWSTTLHASEGTSTTIEVPALKPRAVEPDAPPPPPPAVIAPATVDPHRGRTQRRIALGVGGAGLVALGVGAIYGISAAWTWSDSKAHCRDQNGTPVCDEDGFSLVQDTIRNGNVATLLIGVGLAAVATGGVLWLASPRSRVERRIAIAPALGAELAGLSIQGRF